MAPALAAPDMAAPDDPMIMSPRVITRVDLCMCLFQQLWE